VDGRADPYLYRVYVKWSDDKGVRPRAAIARIRYFSVDPNTGFHLNGKYSISTGLLSSDG